MTRIPAAKNDYAYKALQPGGSVLVTCAGEVKGTVQSAAYMHASRHGWVIRTRKVKGGVRIWRIK